MKPLAWFMALGLAAASAGAAEGGVPLTAEAEARALIGLEFTPVAYYDRRIALHLSCVNEGGALIEGDWWFGVANCQGRRVALLKRPVGKAYGHTTWRIIDTLLLPPVEVELNPDRPDALYLSDSTAGDCEMRGRPNVPFIVLTRWDKQDKRGRINWRTGVEQAWTYDLKRGRIVPLSTRNIICESIEP